MSTRRGFYKPIEEAVGNQQFANAIIQLDSAKTKGKFAEKDRLLYLIDAGLLRYYAGQYDSAIILLHQAETTGDELFTKSISKAALSLVLNDNALEYAGEEYELVYVNLIKSLCFLELNQFDGAMVELRRVQLRLEQLEQKYNETAAAYRAAAIADTSQPAIPYEARSVRFSNSAFARFLGMTLYAADNKPDDARIEYDYLHDAFRSQTESYPFTPPALTTTFESSPPLTVVALVGRAPRKEAFTLRLRTDKDLDLVQILTTDSDGNESEYGHLSLPIGEDYFFKFAIPRLADRPSAISSVTIRHGSKSVGELALLEDLSHIAHESFQARSSLIYLRTVARAVVKGLATHKLKKKADTGGFEGWLKKAAIDVGSDLTENPDLRCAQFLPGRVFVGQFAQTDTGQVTIEFCSAAGQPVSSINVRPTLIGSRRLPVAIATFLQ